MRVGYLVHDLNDAAVLRRARMLEIGEAHVTLAGFSRETSMRPEITARAPLVLGQSHDAAFLQRAKLALSQAVFNADLARHFENCDVIIARNLEQLAIASRVVGERPLVYECLDIHRLLLDSSVAARAVQAIEGALLPKCDLLITSSPAFERNYFKNRPLSAPVELIENKLLIDPEDSPPAPPSEARDSDGPVTIGWFGMLRCKRTLSFLEDLVDASNGAIEVLIAGKPSTAELPDLPQRVSQRAGITFHGPYTYADLPELYGRCDFAWSIDWFEDGLNSFWLLPNRLYEAITYGCVPIALDEVEVGRWLDDHKVGLCVDDAEDAKAQLLSMSRERASVLRAEVTRIDPSLTTATRADCKALVARIEKLLPR